MGPTWVYWIFTIEWYCQKLSCSITSHWFPWANMANRVTANAQLTEVGKLYDCLKEISYKKTPGCNNGNLNSQLNFVVPGNDYCE